MPNEYLTIAGEDDAMGEEDVLGADPEGGEVAGDVAGDDGAVGARRRMVQQRRQQPQQQQRPMRRAGSVAYPIDSQGTIPAGETKVIETRPQRPNYPRKFVTESAGFLINSIAVGVDPVFAASGSVSSAVFSPNAAESPPFEARLCASNQSVVVSVTNTNAAAARFTGLFYGDKV